MKIAITGAQSTGKTTLLNALRSEFIDGRDTVFLDEVTNDLVKFKN